VITVALIFVHLQHFYCLLLYFVHLAQFTVCLICKAKQQYLGVAHLSFSKVLKEFQVSLSYQLLIAVISVLFWLPMEHNEVPEKVAINDVLPLKAITIRGRRPKVVFGP